MRRKAISSTEMFVEYPDEMKNEDVLEYLTNYLTGTEMDRPEIKVKIITNEINFEKDE